MTLARTTIGVYGARRAAALSGVPRSTLHYWARNDIVVPSVSAERVKLWSYFDLLALRAVKWMREPEEVRPGVDRPPVSMQKVRRALDALRAVAEELWTRDADGRLRCALLVDLAGEVVLRDRADEIRDPVSGQMRLPELNLLAEFAVTSCPTGPDLVQPRPLLRIVPGRLSGEPHVFGTRVPTQGLAGLRARGLGVEEIGWLYPRLTPEQIRQALDLEDQLAQSA